MITTLTQTCPACGNPLRAVTENNTTIVYCCAGRCPSDKSNLGVSATDQSVDELAQRLIVIVEDDRSWD